jgi:hypothetical protein
MAAYIYTSDDDASRKETNEERFVRTYTMISVVWAEAFFLKKYGYIFRYHGNVLKKHRVP